jgi:stearoyl-CoA desaturase (Delta-9 desaturase)
MTAQNSMTGFHLTPGAILFLLLHVACLGVFFVSPTATALMLCAATFCVRKFGITAGFHRFFSHRSFKTSRVFQFLLAFAGGMSAQKGALWWAAHHRHHHQHSDTEEDVHSVKQHGFYWAHVGWVLSDEFHGYDGARIKDFARFPELVFLNRFHFIPPICLAAVCLAVGGLPGFFWGFCVSTVLLYHSTFAINSLCHLFGSQRYVTGDASRNSLILALLTFGEGWHNNHHRYPFSARQGFVWWEIDVTYYVLCALRAVGIIWDVKEPPASLLQGERQQPEPVHAES